MVHVPLSLQKWQHRRIKAGSTGKKASAAGMLTFFSGSAGHSAFPIAPRAMSIAKCESGSAGRPMRANLAFELLFAPIRFHIS